MKKSVSMQRHKDGSITIKSRGGVDLRNVVNALAGLPPENVNKQKLAKIIVEQDRKDNADN